jgi:valyl-tRNA synthetase
MQTCNLLLVKIFMQWFENKFNKSLADINLHYDKYRMSDALMATYKLVWDDFCAWYLEMIKPAFGAPISQKVYDVTMHYFENILKVMHPWMPFITEELWHLITERNPADCIIVANWPVLAAVNESINNQFELFAETVTQIRNIRASSAFHLKKHCLYLLNKNQLKIRLVL